jgi:hypothetical protein
VQRVNLIEAVVRPDPVLDTGESATGIYRISFGLYYFVKAFFFLEKMILFLNFKKEGAGR